MQLKVLYEYSMQLLAVSLDKLSQEKWLSKIIHVQSYTYLVHKKKAKKKRFTEYGDNI